MGCFVEATFIGCSNASLVPMLAGSFTSLGGAVLHLCTQQAGVCAGLVQWPQRSVLHVETYRMRSPSSVTEPWAQQLVAGGAAPAAAVAAPAAPALAAPDGGASAQPTSQELQKKVAELKRRLQHKRSIGEALSDRAEAALAGSRRGGPRRKRRRKGSDESSSEP